MHAPITKTSLDQRVIKPIVLAMLHIANGLRRLWRRLTPSQKRHWASGIAMGVLIEIALSQSGGFSVMVGLKNFAMDSMLRLEEAFATDTNDNRHPRLTFIDIGEATWRHPLWGAPDRAPRDRVAQLITYALGHGAKVVVVDILIEEPSSNRQISDEDQKLRSVLSSLKNDQSVIFSRSLRRPLPEFDDPVHRVAPVMPPSPIDGSPSSGAVIAAIPAFNVDRDAQVRSWSLWNPVCVPSSAGSAIGAWGVRPSIQLAAVAQIRAPANANSAPWQRDQSFGRCSITAAGIMAPGLQSPERANEAVRSWI